MFKLIPSYFKTETLQIENISKVDKSVFSSINKNLENINNGDPKVSIVIAAWNEELNIIKCIDTLSRQITEIPFEIIVVDNNSSDKTKDSLAKLDVTYLFEKKQGCGPARQLGQENANGTYIMLADADCLYPPKWLDIMAKSLEKEGVVCVYGNYSFITDNHFQKFGITFYEMARVILSIIRHSKRPFLNCLGMSMGYVKELGLKIGFIEKNIRGEDGRLAYSLMEYGSIKREYNSKAKVWTGYRTIVRKGSLMKAFYSRIILEVSKIKSYTKKIEKHDPKSTLSEENPSAHITKD